MARIVNSLAEALDNIRNYAAAIAEQPLLAARIRQHRAWYAVRDAKAGWIFGPSKFIGYSEADADAYLASYNRKDGGETEAALEAWFTLVDPSSALGKELKAAFDSFADRYDKTANANWRVSVPHEELARAPRLSDSALDRRIAFDPDICGGRAHIRGTRMRVSDVVAAVAEGESIEEILADFPYLEADDVWAALRFAAQAIDHRVLPAA